MSTAITSVYPLVRRAWPSIWGACLFSGFQIALIILPDIVELATSIGPIAIIGLAFFTIRNVAYVIDVYRDRTASSWIDLIFVNSFFATYSAGPIETTRSVNSLSTNVPFAPFDILYGLFRILFGILKFYLFGNAILSPLIATYFPAGAEQIAHSSPHIVLGLCLANWLLLYIQFSGYADIAIGSGRVFGIKIRENFNFPIAARNIQDFWQRWNISVMNFVSDYVYTPFVRKTGLRLTGIFLVFFSMGMWHAISVGYFFWGVAHASAMTVHFLFRRSKLHERLKKISVENKFFGASVTAAAWVLTLSFVSVISAISTAPDLELSLAYVRGLLP